jgi:hypothetical protein
VDTARAIDEFVDWYCSEPRLALNRTVVLRDRTYPEARELAPGTINFRLGAVRRLAYEAADSGLLIKSRSTAWSKDDRVVCAVYDGTASRCDREMHIFDPEGLRSEQSGDSNSDFRPATLARTIYRRVWEARAGDALPLPAIGADAQVSDPGAVISVLPRRQRRRACDDRHQKKSGFPAESCASLCRAKRHNIPAIGQPARSAPAPAFSHVKQVIH